MSEDKYFKYFIGGIFIAGLGVNFAMKGAIDSWRKSRLEQRVLQAQKYSRNDEGIVKINPNADLQVLFGNFKTDDFSKDSDRVLLARMMLGEAENCSDKEKIAVAYVAKNRARDGKKWNGETLKEAILKPYQFSCFNKIINGRVNHRLKGLKDPMNYNPKDFQKNLILAKDFLENKYSDPTDGATFYYNPHLANPSWAKKLNRVKVSGTIHWFFKEK